MYRRQAIAAIAGALLFVPAAAIAQAGSWDGTWSGTTARGGSVQITIAGNRVTSYVFRGQPANITGSQVSGNSVTINVHGSIPGTVKLTRKGTAQYSYSDTSGGNASATLSKQ